jgi:diguanylate cyclase (GGDEF)-like protein
MSIDRLVPRVGMILESSPVRKSMIIPYFMIFVMTQYLFFDMYCLVKPSAYINNTTIVTLIPLKIIFILISMVMLFLEKKLEASPRAQQIVPYVFTTFYITSLMTMGYFIGHLSMIAGMVMAAAPLFSIILFKDRVTLLVLALGAIGFSIICSLYINNILPYAPLFISSSIPDKHEKLFSLYCILFFAIPHYFSFIAATFLIVKYWQTREENYRHLSLTDNLMEMANRRGISAHLALKKTQHQPSQPLSIIMADIDFFKNVNDTYGHAAGDIVLRQIGESIKTSLRDSDQVGRYGGEEFLIVLPDTSLECARHVAERCRQNIESSVIVIQKATPIQVTTSFGIYCSTDHKEDILDMIHQADMQLYRAKQNGRNRVCAEDVMIAV